VSPDLVGEAAEELDGDERHVCREHDGEIGLGRAERCGEPYDRSPHFATVVDDFEGKTEAVTGLPHDEDVAERLLEQTMRALT
jgi:hypothetical protein